MTEKFLPANPGHRTQDSGLKSQVLGPRPILLFLDNPNLMYRFADENQNKGNVRETFFINQIKANHEISASETADFTIDGMDFEVGGKHKGMRQIKSADKGFIVKDDIETSFLNAIPLWHFGLMY